MSQPTVPEAGPDITPGSPALAHPGACVQATQRRATFSAEARFCRTFSFESIWVIISRDN